MGSVLLGIVVAFFTVAIAVDNGSRTACTNTMVETGYETKYVGTSMWNRTCYVKVNERWVPLDKWRVDE
jgi:hypothetical protein